MISNVERILRDLYRIDPALRAEEDALKKTIQKLLDEKPDSKLDPRFEKELRDTLLAKFSVNPVKKERIIGRIFSNPVFGKGLGAAAAACLVLIAVMQFYPGLSRGKEPEPQKPGLVQTAEPSSKGDDGTKTGEAPLAATPQALAPRLRKENSRGSDSAVSPVVSPLGGAGMPDQSASEQMQFAKRSMEEEIRDKDSFDDTIAVPAIRDNPDFNTEGYDRIRENAFAETVKEPLSTFSIDVDTASYANVRRFLSGGSLPYPDAVRIEELVNYFNYDYPEPSGDDPISVETELSKCPWNADHLLLRIGLQAKRIAPKDIPPTNLVFLIDVSGSMSDENKLPLVKESLKLLVAGMRQQDRIALVVYSGSAGLVLPATSGDHKNAINAAIDNLESGGSTAGGEGILLAYETARKAYIKNGNNRVILATDGDFNIGASSDSELVRMIEEKRKEGIFLTVLGFGTGNYKDSKMQGLADSGNGNYAYIDTLKEAQKALVKQMTGTLFTIAKDVKLQIEFNPTVVGEYRLIGYENRVLAARDFADDTKDAGELGAGTSVTALYELIPAAGSVPRTDLKYQKSSITPAAAGGNELMTVKFRYKKPNADISRLFELVVPSTIRELNQASANHRFAAAVAEWGLLLRKSEYSGKASWSQVLSLAAESTGTDPEGYRAEFISLAAKSKSLAAEKE